MSKIFYIQFLFVYVLLFQFVSNKEKFFIKHNENKWEFTLNDNTQGGSAFYQLLKDNSKSYDTKMEASKNYLKSKSLLHLSSNGAAKKFGPGSIIASADEIRIVTKGGVSLEKYEQIGQLNQPGKFAHYLKKLNEKTIVLQFLLVNEEEATKTPRNLGEKKLKTINKIETRQVKAKSEYFWRNIGWKLLKSLKSLFI